MQIAKDTVATIEYTVTNSDGKLIDTSKDRSPMTYLHGNGTIIPGVERALEGKSAGDSVKVVIPAADAYGEKDPNMVQSVPRENFGGIEDIKAGMQFRAQTPGGARIVTVVRVEGDTITIDANHPLAGQTLVFEATVVEARAATEDELAHGHACMGQCGNPECQ